MKRIYSALSLLLVFGILYTLNDMQTHQGIGYWFFLKTNALSRFAWDVIIDAFFIVLFTAIILLISMQNKTKDDGWLFRVLTLYVSFVTPINMSYIFSLIFNWENLTKNMGFKEWMINDLSLIELPIVVLIFSIGIVCYKEERKLKKEEVFSLIKILIFIILSAIVPYTAEYFIYLASLVTAVTIYNYLEKSKFRFWPFWGFIYIMAWYKLIMVSAMF